MSQRRKNRDCQRHAVLYRTTTLSLLAVLSLVNLTFVVENELVKRDVQAQN